VSRLLTNRSRLPRLNNARDSRPHVIAIVGPGASGKTALAVHLAKKFNGVVLNADVFQMYRGMPIGTATPTRSERKGVPHYLFSFLSPRRRYSAGQFQKEAYRLIPSFNRPVFIVGGNGLYIDAVLKGYDFGRQAAQPKLRRTLERHSISALLKKLHRLDPLTFTTIDRKNKRRLVRALEYVISTGQSFYGRRAQVPPAWHVLKIGIRLPIAKIDLLQRKRMQKMIRQGWVREATRVKKRFGSSAPALVAHGYRELLRAEAGETSRQAAIEQTAHTIHQYNKRQLNWFKKDPTIHWVSPTAKKKAARLVTKFLAQ
jgi:tRNA dimethylallyltransferase